MTDGPTTPPPSAPPPGAPVSLVDRVKNILVSPKTEWHRIDTEPATIGSIYTGYVMILAAIPALAGLIGTQLMGGFYAPSLSWAIGNAVVGYVFSLIAVYVLALVIDMLAPTFGGTRDMVKSFKVAAYAYTPAWILGILAVIPPLMIIGGIAGLIWCAYLLYLGLGPLKNVAADKTVGYAVVAIVVLIVLYILIGIIVGALMLAFFGAGMMAAPAMRY